MEFYKKLYISRRIKDLKRIKSDLKRGRGHLSTYLLVLAAGPDGGPQLEIMHCANLQSRYYRERPPFIVGIADGKADAIEMVNSLTQEAFEKTGQWNAARYLAQCTGKL